jgi:drug/metabolite transporter (DMT)-like permease
VSRTAAVLLLIAAACIWGATFPVVKGALADASTPSFLALRFTLAALVLLPALRARGGARRGVPRAALAGVALFAGYLLQTWGLETTTPARSAFITAFSIILVLLLEPLVGMGRPSARVWGGALLALAGLAVLLRPEVQPVSAGDLLTFGCAVVFAVHVLLLQWTVRALPATGATAVQVAVTAALALGVASAAGWRVSVTPRLAFAVAVTALLATVFAFWVLTGAQRVLSAALSSVVLAFEPVAAGAISVLLGQDRPTAALFVGGVLVVAGVVVATAERRRDRPAERHAAASGEPRRPL